MSYSEKDGTVTLTMSPEDYGLLDYALLVGIHRSRTSVEIRNWQGRRDRLNQGNPNYTPYQVPERGVPAKEIS